MTHQPHPVWLCQLICVESNATVYATYAIPVNIQVSHIIWPYLSLNWFNTEPMLLLKHYRLR